MIEPAEIERKAEEFEINSSDVQRDYILGWFLWGIFSGTDLKEKVFLKGGNALRKGYFENTRFSRDIDLGMHGDLAPEFIKAEINKACALIQEKVGVTFDLNRTQIGEQKRAVSSDEQGQLRVFEATIYFKDFYSHADHLTLKLEMDFTRFDRTILPIQQRRLIHPYSDASAIGDLMIPMMQLEEILATKLKCLLQREHSPDLYDLVYPQVFETGQQIDQRLLVTTFLRKTIFENAPAVVREILLQTPFDFFRTYWKDVTCASATRLEVADAILKFDVLIKEWFGGYVLRPFDANRFFASKTRNPILKAARTQTILKVTYKGYARRVEPYSLKYQKAKNKEAQEYLFVWNLEGGSQSEPGLRMFMPENLQSIENTEEKFSPRYQIELNKAGDPVEDFLLFDPAKQKTPTSRGRGLTRPTFGKPRQYVIRCPVCQKTFKRDNPFDFGLNSHKNQRGQPCYGSYGRRA